MELFPTPTDAVRGDIPARYAREIAIFEWGDFAFVVLQLNEPPSVEFEEGVCKHVDGGWRLAGSSGGLGSGWTVVGDSGVVSLSGEAPDAAAVRVRSRDRIEECPVRRGAFLFTAWGVSAEEYQAVDGPIVVAHVASSGAVVDPPDDPERVLAVDRWMRELIDEAGRDVDDAGVGISTRTMLPGELPDEVRDRIRDLHRRGGASEVRRPDDAGQQGIIDRVFDALGGGCLSEVPEHHRPRQDHRDRVRETLPRDVGGAPVHGFEDRVLPPDVGARYETEPTHEAGAEIGQDVAVEVR